jgi:hypothetical protein
VLEQNTFVVTSTSKLLSSRNSYEILDESGKVTGTAEQATSGMASWSACCRSSASEPNTVSSSRRSRTTPWCSACGGAGLMFKKVQVVDAQGR